MQVNCVNLYSLLIIPMYFSIPRKSVQPSSQNDKLARLIEEKNGAESQVAFLNSIIVDLHEKNRELEERVRNMLVLGDTVKYVRS